MTDDHALCGSCKQRVCGVCVSGDHASCGSCRQRKCEACVRSVTRQSVYLLVLVHHFRLLQMSLFKKIQQVEIVTGNDSHYETDIK